MMRISDTVYYKVIKDTDLAEASLDDALELLWESSREAWCPSRSSPETATSSRPRRFGS